MNLKEAQRLRDLEKENTELKKMLAEEMLKAKALKIALEKTSKPRAVAPYGRSSSSGVVVFRAKSELLAGLSSFDLALPASTGAGSPSIGGGPDRASEPRASDFGL